MKDNNNKVNKKVKKRFNPLDRVELVLGAFLKQGHISSGYLSRGNNGFYNAGDYRYISYGKTKNHDEKRAFMTGILKNPYTFSSWHREKSFKIFSFMHVRKTYEHRITQALTARPEHVHTYWERWCLFEDGTILEPRLTEKLIKKMEIQGDQKLREENDYLDTLLSASNLKERNRNIKDMDEIPF